MKQIYFLYILRCNDGTYYTGISTDVNRRLKEHNQSSIGAKYTKTRRPVTLLYSKVIGTRSEACKEEHRVKRLSRKEKELYILN